MAGTVYAYLLLWLSLHTAFERSDIAVATSLLTYTVIGLITYIRGRAIDKKGLIVYGGILSGICGVETADR